MDEEEDYPSDGVQVEVGMVSQAVFPAGGEIKDVYELSMEVI